MGARKVRVLMGPHGFVLAVSCGFTLVVVDQVVLSTNLRRCCTAVVKISMMPATCDRRPSMPCYIVHRTTR